MVVFQGSLGCLGFIEILWSFWIRFYIYVTEAFKILVDHLGGILPL